MSRHKAACLLLSCCALMIGCEGSTTNPVSSSPIGAATPTPTPSPVPTPYVPPPNGEAVCVESEPDFAAIVTEAIDQVRADRPEIFDYDTLPGWILTIRPGRFVQTVVDSINLRPPYKAIRHWRDYEHAVIVKNDNEYSETYFILTSFDGIIRVRSYTETCRPAEF